MGRWLEEDESVAGEEGLREGRAAAVALALTRKGFTLDSAAMLAIDGGVNWVVCTDSDTRHCGVAHSVHCGCISTPWLLLSVQNLYTKTRQSHRNTRNTTQHFGKLGHNTKNKVPNELDITHSWPS